MFPKFFQYSDNKRISRNNILNISHQFVAKQRMNEKNKGVQPNGFYTKKAEELISSSNSSLVVLKR